MQGTLESHIASKEPHHWVARHPGLKVGFRASDGASPLARRAAGVVAANADPAAAAVAASLPVTAIPPVVVVAVPVPEKHQKHRQVSSYVTIRADARAMLGFTEYFWRSWAVRRCSSCKVPPYN